MVDGCIIFILIFVTYLEAKRGFFRSLVDVVAVVIATKGVRLLLPGFHNFLARVFSENTAYIMGAILLFLFIAAVIFILGNIVYRMTLLTIGDPFENILAAICGLVTSGGLVHFILLLIMTFGGDALKEAVNNSLLGEPLYSFGPYFWLVEKLKPLTDPGPIYF